MSNYSIEKPDGKGGFTSEEIPQEAVDLIVKSMGSGAGPVATSAVASAVYKLALTPTAVKMIYFKASGQLDVDKTPKPKKPKIIGDKEAEVFLDLAEDISGGWGLWGHEFMERRSCQLKATKAWVTKLRAAGMADVDILFYGDWKDGRHTADAFEARDSIAKLMDKIHPRNADEVRRENESNYDLYEEMKEKLAKALGPGGQPKRYAC